jgi:opacity protein-like surface antigen
MRPASFVAILGAILGAITGAAVNAQEGIYVGIGFGNFDYREKFIDSLLGRVADETSIYKILGGFEINDYLAIEINYGQTSDLVQSVTGDFPPLGNLSYTLSQDFTMTSLKAIGQYPMDWGALLGGVGYYSSENDYLEFGTADCCDPVSNGGTFRDEGMAAMVGIEWRFGRFGTRYAFRLEYEYWDIDLVDTSAVGLAFSYGF